jgi:nitrate/nitrite transport system substrate-binding protein
VLEAARWIDASEANRRETAQVIAQKSYVNTDAEVILGRILGHYDNGIGKKWEDASPMRFYNDGAVSFPYLSDGMWFMTQHRRWGLLKEDPDYLAVAKKVNQIELFRQAAAMVKANVPKDLMRSSRLVDGVVWDGKDPLKYAGGFKVRVA